MEYPQPARTPKRPMGSPWGEVQTIRAIAPGIDYLTTAGHGGLYLDQERWKELHATFPMFKPFAGQGYLEEDCDYNYAVLCWPQFFSIDQRMLAVEACLSGTYFTMNIAMWRTTDAALDLIEEVTEYRERHAQHWRRGGGYSHGGTWVQRMYRGPEQADWLLKANAPWPTGVWFDRLDNGTFRSIEE